MNSNDTFPVKIHDISIDAALKYCTSKHNSYRFIVTPNVDHICRVYKDESAKKYYSNADLCICDSKILQYISYLKGSPIKHVVRGSDLTDLILTSIDPNDVVLVVGDSLSLQASLKEKFKLNHVSVIAPTFGFEKNQLEVETILAEITKKQPDFIFLAVGSPKQEILAIMLREHLSKGIAICCGNAINFAVGNVKRSPKWMSQVGLEWLHRAYSEPTRMIPRYFRNLEIFRLAFTRGNRKNVQ